MSTKFHQIWKVISASIKWEKFEPEEKSEKGEKDAGDSCKNDIDTVVTAGTGAMPPCRADLATPAPHGLAPLPVAKHASEDPHLLLPQFPISPAPYLSLSLGCASMAETRSSSSPYRRR